MASASAKPLQSSESAYFEAMQMLTEEFSNISQTMDELYVILYVVVLLCTLWL